MQSELSHMGNSSLLQKVPLNIGTEQWLHIKYHLDILVITYICIRNNNRSFWNTTDLVPFKWYLELVPFNRTITISPFFTSLFRQ